MKVEKTDDRTKRRLKEMKKITKDGTSTEFDRGYTKGVSKVFSEIKNRAIQ